MGTSPSRVGDSSTAARPRADGKFLYAGDRQLWVKGVTYGTFRSGPNGDEFLDPETVARDFERMASHGINAIRTYTVPPRWLLDLAEEAGLRVMVGLPWEQHVAFLDSRRTMRNIGERICAGVRASAGHPAILCYAVGNEIPASIVRWHGRRRVERFIRNLYLTAKAEDPGALVTYVNYPSTEYLQLPFIDLVCFNVYLESPERLEAYLARLQNIAGNRPLLMAEIGLDSLRHGERRQAEMLERQLESSFAAGCAGAFVFAWTDEWHRGGVEIQDWAFGITDRQRQPKPALSAVGDALAKVPFGEFAWPRFSVIVCSYNGARTLGDCLAGLRELQYPDFEVIVVDDGSSDATAQLAADHGFAPIRIENRGLSNARNVGLAAAKGELVAYLDDDARPSPHWLKFLADAFSSSDHAGIGGPNVAPPGDGFIAQCVSRSPGWPVHVLLSDDEAEHIPGCNMAFRKSALEAVGGFDPQFHTAGDDVDLCWRLRERGLTLGFSPGAMVWHHPRSSLRAYWKQQAGYGRAEALLERKWPEQYNGAGHLSWAGRIYANGHAQPFGRRTRIYHGRWGSAPFQPLYHSPGSSLWSLLLLPECYFGVAISAALSVLGLAWLPLAYLGLPLLALTGGALLATAAHGGAQAMASSGLVSRTARARFFGAATLLHLVQPLARLYGRLRHGLVPWRRLRNRQLAVPRPRRFCHWSERWTSADQRLRSLAARLRADGVAVRFGGEFDRWDLAVRAGAFGSVRLRLALEEHGRGRQLARFKVWPRWAPTGMVLAALGGVLFAGALQAQAWTAATVLGLTTLLLLIRPLRDSAAAMAAVNKELGATSEPLPEARPLVEHKD